MQVFFNPQKLKRFFYSVDDLGKVSGIGSGTIKQLHDVITVEAEKSAEAPVASVKYE